MSDNFPIIVSQFVGSFSQFSRLFNYDLNNFCVGNCISFHFGISRMCCRAIGRGRERESVCEGTWENCVSLQRINHISMEHWDRSHNHSTNISLRPQLTLIANIRTDDDDAMRCASSGERGCRQLSMKDGRTTEWIKLIILPSTSRLGFLNLVEFIFNISLILQHSFSHSRPFVYVWFRLM